jgi:hypothetical protein
MMLGKPDHVDAELVGQPRLAERLVNYDAVPLGIPAVRNEEITEFHADLRLAQPTPRWPSSGACQGTAVDIKI